MSLSSHDGADLSDDTSEECSASSNKSVISNKSPVNVQSGGWKNYSDKFSPALADNKHLTSSSPSVSGRLLDERMVDDEVVSQEQKEKLGLANVGRKTNFVHYEKVNSKNVNVVQGLELHTRVFSADEQKKIVESVYEFQRLGQKGRLRGSYSYLT